MVKVYMGVVKAQPRKAGGYMVTLPVAVAKMLQIQDNQRLVVFFDAEKEEVSYKKAEG